VKETIKVGNAREGGGIKSGKTEAGIVLKAQAGCFLI